MKSVIGRILNSGLLALALIVTGCGGSDDGAMANTDTGGQCDKNQAVYDIMQSWYYWYAEMPNVDPANYASPEALLDVLTQPEQDLGKHYSYLTTEEEEAAFLNNAEVTGFGFNLAFDQNGRLFVQESFDDGPAYVAGMRRGDEITHIDGIAISSMTEDMLIAAVESAEATFEGFHRDGEPYSVKITAGEYETPVVAHVQTDLGAEQDTTYIFFRSFVNPAFDELDAAFAKMNEAQDTQLVLDLRYNGGGLISVAEHLGSLVAGADHGGTVPGDDGRVIAEITYNDKHQDRNHLFYIDTLANTVDVTDLVVITSGSTASASEMIINGLQPHMNVATVGTTTYGKPVGQSKFEFCEDDILRAIAFKVVNSEGEGDYFEGIPATCEAFDDVLDPLGDPNEASLQAALYYLANGATCDPATSTKALRAHAKQRASQPMGNPLVRDGWDVLTGGAR